VATWSVWKETSIAQITAVVVVVVVVVDSVGLEEGARCLRDSGGHPLPGHPGGLGELGLAVQLADTAALVDHRMVAATLGRVVVAG
jgi:hypothetical protein